MRLIELAIYRWQIALVLFLALAAVGTSAFLTTPRSVDPHFSAPLIGVIVTSPGTSPADLETSVARPIEELLQGLDGIVRVSSRSTDSVAQISAEFTWDRDPEAHFDEVVREVNAIRGSLPSSIERISVERFRTSDAAVLQIALVSETASYRRLEKYSRDLRERLSQVSGVRLTTAWAIPPSEARVTIDPGKLAQLGLPVAAVTDALRNVSVDLAAGAVHSGDQRLNVQVGGAFRELKEIEDLPIRVNEGSLVRIRDVAAVSWDYAEPTHIARFNGERAIWVTINQKDNDNVLDVRRRAIEVIDAYRGLLPPDVKVEVGFDQSFDISAKLKLLARDFMIALGIVLITLLPLGWRASGVVMVSVPLSLATGCAILAALGFTLNELSIAGFIIALGLLVDDSIVVTENIARHLREGKPRDIAAIKGTQQVAVAALGCTIVLLLAFLPLAFLPEAAGKFVRSLPVAVMGTVAASLVIAVTIIPFLASRFLRKDEPEEGNWLLRKVESGIERTYSPLLKYSLDNPRTALSVTGLVTAASLLLAPILGISLFPGAETSYFLVEVNGSPGAALEKTDRAVRFVEDTLSDEPVVENVLANVGRSNPRVFYNTNSFEQRSNFGGVLAVLEEWHPVEGPALLDRLRKKFAEYSDAQLVIRTFQKGPPIDAPIAVKVIGPELEELKRIAAQVQATMEEVPGTRDIQSSVAADFPRLELNLDVEKAALLGVEPGAPRQALRLALAGETAGRIRDQEADEYDIKVRLPLNDRHAASVMDDVYVPGRFGSVAIREIANPRLGSGPVAIEREDQQRSAYITSEVADGYLTAEVNDAVFDALEQVSRPNAYRFEVGGEAEQTTKSFGGIGPIVTLAAFGILVVLVIEFGSFRETIVVAGVVPLGVAGGLAALFLTGNSLSFTAVLGFVVLIGIEIKNSILLVDFTSQLRQQGIELRTAIERAGKVRFLPVVLTSVTAIGGLLPLALSGSGLYGPLAWVIIGGLISSTLLSRVVTPTMYLLLMRNRSEASEPVPIEA